VKAGIAVIAGLAAALVACHSKMSGGVGNGAVGHATIRSASGATLGELALSSSENVIHIKGHLTSLSPGAHGIHIHETGKCDAPGFATAGAHLNPGSTKHGLNNPAGPHAGDMPNIMANAAGEADVDLITRTAISLTPGTSGGLFDADGSAIVVHAQEDDQVTDPSGNSGARIACGVVER